jgi:peptidoglycan/LPS O-acetylase OafA/YrhL
VAFFVISGFVISYVTEKRENTIHAYAFSRLSRLYSVAIPALLIGLAASFLTEGTPGVTHGILATVSNFAFVGQISTINLLPPLNTPYWSLNYEAWYYAAFAAARFVPGSWRWAAAAIVMLAAGPKIIALFPCWLLGVALHRYGPRVRMSGRMASLTLVGCLALAALVFVADVGTRLRAIMFHDPEMLAIFGASNKVGGDTILGLLFAAGLLAASKLDRIGIAMAPIAKPMKWLAARTFSIYLFHMPVFALLRNGLGLAGWSLALVEVVAILALAQITELQLPALRRWIESVWPVLSARTPVPPRTAGDERRTGTPAPIAP